jgi:hypothetical protein
MGRRHRRRSARKNAPERKRDLWAFDFETTDWDVPLAACAVSQAGEVVQYFCPDCIVKMVAHMKHARGTYLAHYGGGFDIPLALNHHKFRKVILSGSNVLIAEDKHNLTVRDTYPWFLNSLANIGKALGYEKDISIDRGNLAAYTQKEILDYCTRDCRVVMHAAEGALSFLKEHDAAERWTAGSSAMSLMRALEPGSWAAMRAHRCDVDLLREALENGVATGGRTESPARGYRKRVYAYDIKSSYPSRYANRPLGIGLRRATRADKVGVWRCRWVWPDRFKFPPALDKATHAGVGPCEGWLTDEEIECFERCGVPVNRFEGYAPITTINLGQLFVQVMYAEKERGSYYAKVWLNSAHGKWAEHPLKDCYTLFRPSTFWEPGGIDPEGPYWHWSEIKVDEDGKAPVHCHPIAAAQVMARARIGLWECWKALQDAGWEVYYGDTDSVHTNCPPEHFPLPLGKLLGQWSFEGGPYEGYYLGPKAYLLIDENGVPQKSALKGVPLRSYVNAIEAQDERGTYIREAKRAAPERPGPANTVLPAREAEPGRDLRKHVFMQALDGGARCYKDSVTSFLRGIHGVDDLKKPKDEREKQPVKWQRVEVIRTIRPCGRGKAFERDGEGWCYLSTLEMAMIPFLERLREASIKDTHWERVSKHVRDRLTELQYVRFISGRIELTEAGRKFLEATSDGVWDDDDDKYEYEQVIKD